MKWIKPFWINKVHLIEFELIKRVFCKSFESYVNLGVIVN